jgi:dehydrogenase/reductase SDR family member 1
LTQSPHLIGRAIAMLAADPQVVTKSGQSLYAGDVAHEYGFTDVDGRVPPYQAGE